MNNVRHEINNMAAHPGISSKDVDKWRIDDIKAAKCCGKFVTDIECKDAGAYWNSVDKKCNCLMFMSNEIDRHYNNKIRLEQSVED